MTSHPRKGIKRQVLPAATSHEAQSAYQASLGSPNKERYRQTPVGQLTVPDLIQKGVEIKTSYNTGGIVVDVAGPFTYTADDGTAHKHYSLTYVAAEKWGHHKPLDHRWINECVAVDGRILKLFEANHDEVLIVSSTSRFSTDRSGQMSLF